MPLDSNWQEAINTTWLGPALSPYLNKTSQLRASPLEWPSHGAPQALRGAGSTHQSRGVPGVSRWTQKHHSVGRLAILPPVPAPWSSPMWSPFLPVLFFPVRYVAPPPLDEALCSLLAYVLHACVG